MKLGLAQIRPKKGDITANIGRHKTFIEKAVSLQASAIFFPELSLTGYEPQLGEKLACSPDDSRLDEFQEISDRENITIGMGMPTKPESGVLISMIIFVLRVPSEWIQVTIHLKTGEKVSESTKSMITNGYKYSQNSSRNTKILLV